MRALISLLSFIFISSAFGGNIIVTDFDDTIRHTNASSTSGMVWNLLMKKKVFSGMPELLNGMKDKSQKLTVLTGSPDMLRGKVEKTLLKSGVNNDELITKNKKELKELGIMPSKDSGKPSTYPYKIHKITEILKNNPNDNLILLGDDAGGDPEVYAEIAKKFPGRITATYIRAIKNRKIPEGMTKFVTAYDVAWLESLAGRFDRSKLAPLLASIKGAENFRTTIPNFAYCPTDGGIWREGNYPKERELLLYARFIMESCYNKTKEECATCN